MEAALQALQQSNVGIGVLQEINLTKEIHTRYSAGYKVWAMEAKNGHKGGIAIICQKEAGWHVECGTGFGTNVLIFQITEGQKLWYIIGAYGTPNNQTTVYRV